MTEAPRRLRVMVTRRAEKEIATLAPKLRAKLRDILLNRLAVDAFGGKKLVGELAGYWSVRLTHRDRVVYRIDPENHVVFVMRARTQYAK